MMQAAVAKMSQHTNNCFVVEVQGVGASSPHHYCAGLSFVIMSTESVPLGHNNEN